MARDRKSSQRRRANAQPARARPKPTPGKPSAGRPADDAVQADPAVDGARPADPTLAGAGAPDATLDGARAPDAPLTGAGAPDVAPDGADAPLDGAGAPDAPLDGAATPDAPLDDDDGAADDDGLQHAATVDELDDESVIATLEGADLPVGAMPTDPPLLPPVGLTDADTDPADAGEFSSARERLAANRLDESDEILPAARRAGRPPAKVGGNKVTSFLRASWAELQRVQWPDRRQVGQATAVVLGFVVVAGGFLGLADLLGTDVVNAIL